MKRTQKATLFMYYELCLELTRILFEKVSVFTWTMSFCMAETYSESVIWLHII
eukprot:UN08975